VRYRLLGPLEVLRDGTPVEIGGRNQRAVLAALLLDANRVVSTDRLIDAVWGDDHPPSVAASLQAHISNLRRLLRDEGTATSPITRQAPGYRLDVPADAIDVTDFRMGADRTHQLVADKQWAPAEQAAQEALAHWRGPLLPEWQDEDWVAPVAAGLQERHNECAEDLVTALLGTGRVTQALATARSLYLADPLRERACWLYVVTLHRAGRTGEALEVLREHVRSLDDELGLEPTAALRDLQSAVLRQDPDLLGWPGAPAADLPGVIEPDLPVIPPAPLPDGIVRADDGLVGRRRELQRLAGTLAEARAGSTRWVVLTGPAGIGKSRLAEETARQWAAAGGTVVRAACPEDEGVPPWWPVRQVIRALDRDPEPLLAPPSGGDVDTARFVVAERVQQLLSETAAATAGLLVLVDDAQWADPTSLRFLAHLASSPQQDRLAVLLTVRDGTGGDDLRRLLGAAARRPGTRQLAVPPLSADEVGALMAQVSGDEVAPADAAVLAARTGGNPFFVTEYARLPAADRGSGEIPVAVRSVLGRRLAGLDPATLQVLRCAAVLGDPLDLDLLRALTRLDEDELADLLDEAADERIIVPAPDTGRYTFGHALLRDEVLAGMSDVRRRRLHARAAQALGAGTVADRLVRRAAHLIAALPLADPAEALAACRAAAEDADDRWYPSTAAHWWGVALQVLDQGEPDPELRDELVIARLAALGRSGHGQTVLDVVDDALQDALRDGRTRSAGRFAQALLRSAGAWPWVAYGDDPSVLLSRLQVAETMVRDDVVAHVQVLSALAVGSCYDPDPTLSERLSASAIARAETTGDADILADALIGRALAFSGVGIRARESIEVLDRLAALPHRYERVDEVLAHSMLVMAEMTLGRADRAQEHLRSGAVGADLLRLTTARVQLRWAEGMFAQWHGDLDRALQLYTYAFELHEKIELYLSGIFYLAVASLSWEQGRLDRLELPITSDHITWAAAGAAAARGDRAEAARLVAADLARPEPPVWTTHGRLTFLAHLVADLALTEHAEGLLTRLRPLQGCIAIVGHVGEVGPVDLALARLELLLGHPDRAREHLAVAVAVATAAGGRPALLRCRLLAAELDRAGPAEYADIAAAASALGMHSVAAAAPAAAG
jgi:DNA-binding SARP family transcriptional activator